MIPARVVADEREKAGGVPEELSRLNVRVYFSRLQVADYVLSPEIAVERKSVRDLVSSIYDTRLFYQAARISASFAKPYLLIEGDSTEVEGLVTNLRAYYGAIANVTVAYGLRVVYTANAKETAIAISELLAHARAKPLSGLPSVSPPKAKNLTQQQLYVVSSLPGVGGKLAERLLMKYETPRRIMGLTVGELALTQGIGWKRAEAVGKMLDTRFTRSPGTKTQTRLEP